MDVLKRAKEYLLSAGLNEKFGIGNIKSYLDFYVTLKDGVALCTLINNIFSSSVCALFKNSRSSPYRSTTNLSNFLKACADLLNISENDLFTVDDLFEGKNLAAVFYTLSLVSQASKTKNKNIKEFRCKPNMPSIQLGIDFNDVEPSATTNQSPIYEEGRSDIYQTAELFMKDVEENFHTDPSQLKGDYDHAALELVTTEKRYFEGNLMLLSNIFDYLCQKISFSELNVLFNNFQNLKTAHNVIFQSFYKNHITKKKSLARTIIKHKALFLEYVPYVSKLGLATKKANSICKDPKIRSKIENIIKAYDSSNKTFDLKSLLAIPMQHITRYQLHFSAMLKNCKDDEKLHDEIQAGLTEITDILQHINACSKDEGALEDIELLQEKLSISQKDPLRVNLIEFGRINFQAEFPIRYAIDLKNIQKRTILVFDSHLVIAKYRASKLFIKSAIRYSTYRFKNNFDKNYAIESVYVESRNDGKSHTNFSIVFGEKDRTKDSFMTALELSIIKNNIPANICKGHLLDLVTFNENTSCSICKKLLQGLLSQGYVCSNKGCHIKVHLECVPGLSNCYTDAQYGLNKDKDRRMINTLTKTIIMEPVISNREKLDDELWFCGNLERTKTQELLKNPLNGTFLVRVSDSVDQAFVISLKFDNQLRHLKIHFDIGYYLFELRRFPTIKELINYYQTHSLKEAYSKYDTCLLNPVKESKKYIVASRDNDIKKKLFIDFKTGDKLAVLADSDNYLWVVKKGKDVGFCYACFF